MKNYKHLLYVLFVLLNLAFTFQPSDGFSQVNTVITLSKNEVDLGEVFQVTLIVKKNKDQYFEIKDTIQAFKPFDFVRLKENHIQHPDSLTTIETGIFEIRSFQVDSIQKVKIAFQTQKNGVLLAESTNTEIIKMVNRIKDVNDNIQYIPQPDLVKINLPTDNTLLYVIITMGIALSLMAVFVLRKPYFKWREKYKINSEHRKLQLALDHQLNLIEHNQQEAMKEINLLWNKYLDRNWAKKLNITTFQSLTSDEIVDLLDNNVQSSQYFNGKVFAALRKTEEDIFFQSKPCSLLQIKSLMIDLKNNLNNERLRRISQLDKVVSNNPATHKDIA